MKPFGFLYVHIIIFNIQVTTYDIRRIFVKLILWIDPTWIFSGTSWLSLITIIIKQIKFIIQMDFINFDVLKSKTFHQYNYTMSIELGPHQYNIAFIFFVVHPLTVGTICSLFFYTFTIYLMFTYIYTFARLHFTHIKFNIYYGSV